MAVSAPPKKKATPLPQGMAPKASEKKIDEIINRGSSTIKRVETDSEPEKVKNFNVKMTGGQIGVIETLRAQRPKKPTSPKLAISLHDWIQEAIDEKIERERKKFKV